MRIFVIIVLLMATAAHSKICNQGPLFTGKVIAVVHFPEHCQVFIQFSRFQTQEVLPDECKIRDDIAGYFGVFADLTMQLPQHRPANSDQPDDLYQNSNPEGFRAITNPCQLPVRSTVFGLLGRNQFKQVTFSKLQVL